MEQLFVLFQPSVLAFKMNRAHVFVGRGMAGRLFILRVHCEGGSF